MKLRVYRLRSPIACGSPKPGLFDQPNQEYFYECEPVSDHTRPNTGDSNKIGYFDDVVISVNFPVDQSHLAGLTHHLNGVNKFLTVGELAILADKYLKNLNPTVKHGKACDM